MNITNEGLMALVASCLTYSNSRSPLLNSLHACVSRDPAPVQTASRWETPSRLVMLCGSEGEVTQSKGFYLYMFLRL